MKPKKITATKARNNFFGIVQDAYLKNTSYLIEKDHIPMAYIVPINSYTLVDENKEEAERKKRIKNQLILLKKLDKLRSSAKGTKKDDDAVTFIRKMRGERMSKYD